MSSTPVAPRVALAVSPRLVADAIASLLEARGIGAVQVSGSVDEHFAVVVTTTASPTASADLVVELANGPAATTVATVRAPAGGPLVRLQGLPTIIDFVLDWTARGLEVPHGQR